MTDQTEQTADQLQTGQDAPGVETAPEVATEAEVATDPVSPAPEADLAEPEPEPEHPFGSTAHGRRGIQAGPADHPRTRLPEAPAPEADEA